MQGEHEPRSIAVTSFDIIFERIKYATNTRTQVELAEVLGIRQSSISDAKRRNSVPADWYMKLFERYGLNPDWLKKSEGPMYLRTERGYEPVEGPPSGRLMEEPAHYADPDSKGVLVTVHSMQCDGAEDEGWTPKIVGKLNIPASLASPSIVVVRMDASSMEPLIRRGAHVGINTEQRNIVSGEMYGIYAPFEGLTIKRVFLDADHERFILRTENPSHPDQHLSIDGHQTRVVGRLSWVIQRL